MWFANSNELVGHLLTTHTLHFFPHKLLLCPAATSSALGEESRLWLNFSRSTKKLLLSCSVSIDSSWRSQSMADQNSHHHERPSRIFLPPRATAFSSTSAPSSTPRAYPVYPFPAATTPAVTPSKHRLSSLNSFQSRSSSNRSSLLSLLLILLSLRSLSSAPPLHRSRSSPSRSSSRSSPSSSPLPSRFSPTRPYLCSLSLSSPTPN